MARERTAIITVRRHLVNAAGNFYINDKSAGAVVGRQLFGGSRASGTNDKAGSMLNLYRWTNPRTVKDNRSSPPFSREAAPRPLSMERGLS